MDIKDVAKEIRVILKKKFPVTKFSVTISRFSMGSSADVSWTDGPTTAQVDELIGHYGDSRSRFIETTRKHSAELVTQAIAAWRKKNPEYSHFTVTCKGDTSWGFRAEFDINEFYRGSFDLQDCERSLINDFIYGSAFDGTNLILPQEDADDCEPEATSDAEPELVEVAEEVAPQPQEFESVKSISEIEVKSQELLKPESELISRTDIKRVFDVFSCVISAEMYCEAYDWQAQNLREIDIVQDFYSHALNAELYQIAANKYKVVQPNSSTWFVVSTHNQQDVQSTSQPQPSNTDLSKADALQADRQQAYAQYLSSQQEADALEAKLAVKKTEAQVYFAMMKEIDEQIEAKKREAEIIPTAQVQPDVDVKLLEGKQVTLVLANTMGCPVCRHITVIAADIVSAKRYQGDMTSKMCLQLQYVEKGKRKLRGNRYTEADLAVALGWQDIKVPSDFTSFDTELFNTMVSQAKDVVYTQQAGQASTVRMIDRVCID